ncbi:MAG: PEP-CTERM sorting domain-containing protein [Verrucomicrobiota bacterium]
MTENAEIDRLNNVGQTQNFDVRKPLNMKISTVGQLIGRAVCAGAMLLLVGTMNAQTQYIYTTLSVPEGGSTYAMGISGNNIVGNYSDGNNWHGFLYDGNSYTTLDVPGAAWTFADGIDGNNIVGSYNGLGFRYNGNSYIPFNGPGASITEAHGVSGNNIVGWYFDGSYHGFIFSGFLDYYGRSYTTLNVPWGSYDTYASGISGNNIVGYYHDPNSPYTDHGFLYNGSTYTALDVPGAVGDGTRALAISGNNIVGYYQVGNTHHGFLYNGSTYTDLDVPGADYFTAATGIDGNNIVGYYYDGSNMRGFIATPVPEPSFLALLAVGAAALLVCRRRAIPAPPESVKPSNFRREKFHLILQLTSNKGAVTGQ